MKHNKVLDVALFEDGLQVMDGNGKPRLVQLESMRDADILGSILSNVIANTNAGTRPRAPTKSQARRSF